MKLYYNYEDNYVYHFHAAPEQVKNTSILLRGMHDVAKKYAQKDIQEIFFRLTGTLPTGSLAKVSPQMLWDAMVEKANGNKEPLASSYVTLEQLPGHNGPKLGAMNRKTTDLLVRNITCAIDLKDAAALRKVKDNQYHQLIYCFAEHFGETSFSLDDIYRWCKEGVPGIRSARQTPWTVFKFYKNRMFREGVLKKI